MKKLKSIFGMLIVIALVSMIAGWGTFGSFSVRSTATLARNSVPYLLALNPQLSTLNP